MKRKKSPLPHRKGGTSTDSNDSSKVATPQIGSSSPGVLHPPTFHMNISPVYQSSSSHLTVNCATDEWACADDTADGDGRALSGSLPSLGSNEGLHFDEVDGPSHSSDAQRTKAAIEHLQQKICKTKELIKDEQTARDDNVNEYLKLATNADKQQMQRIKSVFEKKNQKSAQLITQLQKKLENYNKRIKDLEIHGLPRGVLRDMGQGLKDVGANIKGGITGLSGGVVGSFKNARLGRASVAHAPQETVMSKPREFAHLIKNKFGSADNINSLTTKPEEGTEESEINIHGSAFSTQRFLSSTRYTSDDDNSSSESGQNHHLITVEGHNLPSSAPSPHHHPPPTQQILPPPSSDSNCFDLEPILLELRSQRDEYQHLMEEIETVKGQIQQESTLFNQALQDERYRYERLEEQMNDLIELHQNEIENLKQGIADMEEKVQYQSEERLRDVHDILDSCQTRVSRMEHQQHQHLQQLVTLDAVENSQARALLLKLVNVALTVLQVILLLVATLSNIITPFLRTRVRTLTTVLLIFVIVGICHQWPDLMELCRMRVSKFLPPLSK